MNNIPACTDSLPQVWKRLSTQDPVVRLGTRLYLLGDGQRPPPPSLKNDFVAWRWGLLILKCCVWVEWWSGPCQLSQVGLFFSKKINSYYSTHIFGCSYNYIDMNFLILVSKLWWLFSSACHVCMLNVLKNSTIEYFCCMCIFFTKEYYLV